MSSVDLAARLARLSPEQRAQLLDRLRQAPAAGPPPLPPLIPRPADAGALPLSFAQQRLWFLAQLDPEDTSYHICRTLELRGSLQVAALEAALEALVHRHEALRTTVASIDDQPTQHIAAPAPLALPLTDLCAHPPAEREALRRQLIDQLARRPFDLAQGPLFRTHLLRLEAEVHVLVLSMHHIAMDGWSLGVLFDELAAIYGARLRGEQPAVPALPVQYADYALWERHWLRGAVLDEQLAYWRQQLAGALPLVELSVRPRPFRRSQRGAHCVVTLPLQPARAVTVLAREEGASAFMALLGAFLVLLYLTTGEEDLVVGTPIAHRARPETERLIGYFANTLALRVRLCPRDSFRALLRNVRAVCLDAYAHQDVPFEKLVEELKPPRSLGHAPFFQLMFQLEDSRFGPRPLAGLDLRLVAEDSGASAYDVTLGLAFCPEGLVADAQYATDLFEEEEIRWLLDHLARVVELVAAEPDRPVQDLRLLSAEQRRQVLVEWNDTARPLSSDRPLHVLLAEQAARSPDAPAAICGEEVLAYRQLDQRAAELAHALRELGVRPGTCVALCFHRSLEALVSLLAVLKAGGHYLPLDPSLPVERLRWIVASSAARLVITSSALRDRCESLSVAVVVPEAPSAIPKPQPASAPELRVDPLDLAYVLYTSGSTGRPKGVMVAHHALVYRCEGLRAAYRLRADDRVLHVASLAFDVAAEELFPTWLAGACVVVWPHPQPPPPAELEQLVARHGVSVLNLPAAYWHLWVDELPESSHALPPTVRLLITGSEPVATERLARWRRLISPQPEWINAYGPTEATITATVSSSASPGFRPAQVPLSIGRPLANTTVYVLDEQLEPTPPGVAGELYLGGASLARGYLDRPELTAERFLPHPYATEPGARLYRTGDLARLWPDGSVQLLGRADHQIKLRGVRIEPGEVEAALAVQPAVRAAVVVPRPHPSGEPRLVAYLVCDGPAPTPAELQVDRRLADKGVSAAVPLLPVSRDGMLALERQLAYWTQHLADAPAELPLPYRGPRPPIQTFRGGRFERSLDAELTGRLCALAHHHGATLFMVLLAALRALLARYTGQRDLCIGTAVANRDRAEIEGLIGMFVNPLVLRGSVHAGDRFVDLLARERDLTLSAYAHAHAPFERVVDALGLPRSTHRMPLVQVTLVDQGDVTGQTALPGPAPVIIEPFPIDLAITPVDLAFEMHERAGVCELTVSYNADLFDRDTVAALVGRYQRLLIGIAACPELPVSQLELLASAERAVLFDEPAWRVTWEPRGPGVVAQVELWMARTPDAPALLWEAGQVSYRELDARSAALAALLRHRGVGPDRTVAVIAERGAPQIIALLAVLRAGGAYVPIKPDLPGQRIGWILDETAPVVIVCDGPPPPALALHTGHAAAVVRLDQPWPNVRDAPDLPARDAPGVPPDALAYVIYTSGSTGRPKGVMVTRRGCDAQLGWMQHEYSLDPGDRVLQLASSMFDFSVVEIFWPLMAGGAVILPRHRGELEPAYLAQLAEQHTATVVHFVPSLLRVVVDACQDTPWTTIEQVFCGGEALSLDLVRASQTVFPRAALHNQYGPTETTINATYWRCHPGDDTVPIGRPVADTTAYVLDDDLAPVPPGGVGQLWIGGVQLARGYLQRPALTAERFRPNPFAARPGERIYQTGDLVRQREDGTLDYCGRSDFQVKIRGFRIELGEIEAVLHDHPQVRTAVVTTRDDGSGGKLLVAYICLSGSAAPAELRDFIAARLPAYMIPSAFVVVDELPLTPSGKLDRKALPAPAADAHQRTAYVAPATPMQELLAEIWREVLGVDRVGIHDSFFALGGHSLLVVRLVARIHRRLGVELSTRSVFESPTIAEQAERVSRPRGAGANDDDPSERELVEQVAALSDPEVTAQLAEWSSVLLEVRPTRSASALAGSRRELADRLIAQHRIDAHPSQPLARRTSLTAPATVAQQLQWDFHQRGNYPTLGIHAAALALRGPLDVPAMHQAIADLVERQAALRTVFFLEHGRLLHTAQPRGPALDVADLSHLPPGERTAEARRRFALISRPHDLTREVFRVQLVRLGDHDHLLFLAPHHIAVDGFSWSVLEADLAALYRARVARGTRGAPATAAAPALAPLELACRDFCFWQRGLADRPVGRAQLAFWARAVTGYQGLELPGDRRAVPRGSIGLATDTYEAASVPFVLDGSRWAAALRLCARLGCTPYVVITSGFLLLLTRWSGRDDVCVLSSNFHRNRPGSEAVIGNFVTPYPLRASFDDRDSLEAAVRHCHDRVLAHREHGHVAPDSALAAWHEWTRYNVNYSIDPHGDAHGDGALDFGAAAVERLPWSALAQRTSHDLALFVHQGTRGVRGNLLYNAERFSPTLMARAAARLGQLIDLIANESSRLVGALPRVP